MEIARDAGRPGEDPVQRHVAKARQVGRADHKAGGWIDRSGEADSQRPDPARRCLFLPERLFDRRHDSVDDVVTAAGRLGGLPDDGAQATAIIGHGDTELGAAKINADEPHQRQRGRGKGRNVSAASRAPTNSATAVARKIR